MNKIKKIFIGFGTFFVGLVSKVFASDALEVEGKYGIFDPTLVEVKYGPYEPTVVEKVSSVGKVAVPIILFVIGFFVILNKKITKKVKAIIVSALIILVVLSYILFNFFEKNSF